MFFGMNGYESVVWISGDRGFQIAGTHIENALTWNCILAVELKPLFSVTITFCTLKLICFYGTSRPGALGHSTLMVCCIN